MKKILLILFAFLILGGTCFASLEDETGATEMRGSFIDGQAWFHDAGGLIAAYVDTGNLLKINDGSGNLGYGFIGEVGTGEALGSDLFDAGAGVFTAGTYSWIAYGTNTIANDANSLKITYVDTANGAHLSLRDSADLSADLEIGKLYKLTFDAKVGAGDSVSVQLYDGTTFLSLAIVTNTNFASVEKYFVASSTTAVYLYTTSMAAGEEIWLDNLVLKEVTEPNANAVHIYKEHSLTNEGWRSLDSGIDYNAGASWDFDIYFNMRVLKWMLHFELP